MTQADTISEVGHAQMTWVWTSIRALTTPTLCRDGKVKVAFGSTIRPFQFLSEAELYNTAGSVEVKSVLCIYNKT